MGGFRIPEHLLRTRISPACGDDLIRAVQLYRQGGAAGATNQGQAALAAWLMHDARRALRLCMIEADIVERLLCGELIPADYLAERIAQATACVVMPQLWNWLAEPRADFPESAGPGDDAGCPPVSASSPATSPAPALCHGRLGERVHGPLFSAVRSPDGAILLTGMGVTLSLDDGMATVARDALANALDRRKAVL